MPVKTKGFLLGAAAGAVLTGAVAAGATAGYQAANDAPRALSGVEQPELIRTQNITPSLIRPPAGAPLSFADIIERVSPAVVSLEVEGQAPRTAAGGGRGLPPQLEEFFGLVPRGGQGGGQGGAGEEDEPATQRTQASGSGFFISADGYLVTNNHVVENARKITVHLSDDRELEARVVGRDEETDLAVLKVEGRNFPFVQFAANAQPRVGDWVVAIGNPFQLNGTATAGIVSAQGRDLPGDTGFVEYLQIDAPINRGNSGGPTFDLNGRVVGVNTAIYSTTGSSAGVGFAIPADTAQRITRQLMSGQRITRGYLGAQVGSVDRETADAYGLREARGALISSVVPNGPAARGGLQQGDIVQSVNGQPIADASSLTRAVAATPTGRPIRLEIIRGDSRRTVTVTAGTRPSAQELANLDSDSGPDAAPSGPAQAQGPAVLGMNLSPAPAGSEGLRVDRVESGSDAAERGIRRGDLVTRINDREVRSIADVQAAVEAARRLNRPTVLAWIRRGADTGPVPIRIQPRAAG